MLVNHSSGLSSLHSSAKATQPQPTQGENSSFNSLLDQMKLSGGPVKAKLDPPTGANLLDQMKLSGGPVKAKLDPPTGANLLDQMKLSGGPVKAKLDPPTGANLLDQMKLSGGPVKAKLDPIKEIESLAQPELSHQLSNMQQVTSIFNTRLLLQEKTFI
jgi:hypothetical protein